MHSYNDYRGSGRVEGGIGGVLALVPFLGFLAFIAIGADMGRMARKVNPTSGEALAAQCIESNKSAGAYTWRDCTQAELEADRPQVFNTLTGFWEGK